MHTKFHPNRRCAIILLNILVLIWATQAACISRPPGPLEVRLLPEAAATNEQQEKVTISGETYIVPAPWTGNRFADPKLEYSDFEPIPIEYTHNSSKIYILAAAQEPVVALMQAAEKEGIYLKIESAYRSAGYQKRIFKRMLEEGRTFDDIVRYVAPPGYSQHMLGTAVDFFPSDWAFVDTPAYTWLQENTSRFGFEETYSRFNPLNMPWEAWHWNFTGNTNGDQARSDRFPARND